MKKVLAAVMASAMAISVAATPFAAQTALSGQDVSGQNSVKNPIYNYQIPLKTEFAVDAFQKATTDGQIYSGNFAIINKSDVPLRAVITPKLENGDSGTVTVKSTPGEINNSASNTAKEMYLEVVPSTAATIETAEGDSATPVDAPVKKPTLSAAVNVAGTEDEGTASTAGKIVFAAVTATPTYAPDGVKFELIINNDASGTVTELASVVSDAITSLGTTANDVTALFNTKEVELPYDPTDLTKGTVKGTLSNTAGVLTFTATDSGLTAFGSNIKAEIVAYRGKEATAALPTEGDLPAYPEYNDTTGSATATKVVALGTGSEKLMFALDKGSYVMNYADDTEPTLVNAVDAATCAGVFRVRGSVNPNAPWQDEDAKLTLTYDVGGVSTTAYANKRAAAEGMNLLNNSVEPAWAASTPFPTTLPLTGSTAVTFKFINGTKDSLLVATADTVSPYTVTVTNATNTEPADVTAAFTLSIANGNVPTLTLDKQALIDSGSVINGANKFTVTFTGTDDYVTTLVTSDVTVSGIPA